MAVGVFSSVASAGTYAGINTGWGEWIWVSPSVQGNTIEDVSFIDADTGWAVGSGGLIMKTADGGAFWTSQTPASSCGASPGSGCRLNGVSFVDANNGWAVGDFGTVWRTVNGGATWSRQTFPSSIFLASVSFANASVGVAVGEGYAYYTTNGGATWSQASGISTSHDLSSVQMTGPGTGYAVGNPGAAGSNPPVYKTVNGGASWTLQGSFTPGISYTAGLNSVFFIDDNHGFAVGACSEPVNSTCPGGTASSGILLRTNNGGATWENSITAINEPLYGVAVAGGGNTLVVAGDAGTIRVASSSIWAGTVHNVAESLSKVTSGVTSSRLLTVDFGASTTGYVAGEAGVVTRTGDTGSSWSLKAGGESNTITGSSFIDADTGWMVGDNGLVIRTTDGGVNWTSDNSGVSPNVHFKGVHFLNSTSGYAAGCQGSSSCGNGVSGGVLYKYSNGTWSSMSLPGGMPPLNSVYMTGSAAGWAAGMDGAALKFDGVNWSQVTGLSGDIDIYSIDSVVSAPGIAWAAGQNNATKRGVILRYDGSGWSETEPQEAPSFLTSIDVVDDTAGPTGYVVGGGGKVYKTLDGGVNGVTSWTPQNSTTGKLLGAVSFLNDAITGVAAGGDVGEGRIIKTMDGGANWSIEQAGTGISVNTVSAVADPGGPAPYVAYAAGASSMILKYPDNIAPVVTSANPAPNATDAITSQNISATFSELLDPGIVNTDSFRLYKEGDPSPVSASVSFDFNSRTATLNPHGDLERQTKYTAMLDSAITDRAGNHLASYQWSFTTDSRPYYFTWYDEVGGDNWILMSNPASAFAPLAFNLSIAGQGMNLAPFSAGGVADPGQTITARYPGVMGGPVIATSLTGQKGIVSQRTLWPSGGNSLDEVSGTDAGKLSHRFYWTWYDQASAGFQNWVLVANPNPFDVYYQIRIAGVQRIDGVIPPGKSVTHQFPDVMGGPVVVQTWKNGTSETASVMASQRVLSNGGTAFNEEPGTPEEELTNRYLWTWYDDRGGSNWVLIANPNTGAGNNLYYEIRVAGRLVAADNGVPIPPRGNVTPRFGVAGGPVEVRTFCDAAHTDTTLACSRAIASQRVIWGPSFEETPGFPYASSSPPSNTYHWTWYDQTAAGVSNWVLVANPSDAQHDITYQIWIAGRLVKQGGPVRPGGNDTPRFPGSMGGPVEVRISSPDNHTAIASQRVLWHGYFNEVMGTVLD